MTAVLRELRRLDAARQRGDITDSEFARIRDSLENAIEDARVVDAQAIDVTPDAPETPLSTPAQLWHIVAFVVLVFALGTALISWVIGDVTLALTLGATVLAAFVVHAAQKLNT